MNTKRILLVDGERVIQEVVQICLSTLGGWQVLTASTVPEGLLVAQNEQPDLILLDLFLPKMTGITFLKERLTSASIQAIPVVILSAGLHPLSSRDFSNFNVTGSIDKPFEVKTLSRCVAQALSESILPLN
jgi:two-component system, OmpR family, alkaline phosphatase synthesis response regulator PhoP